MFEPDRGRRVTAHLRLRITEASRFNGILQVPGLDAARLSAAKRTTFTGTREELRERLVQLKAPRRHRHHLRDQRLRCGTGAESLRGGCWIEVTAARRFFVIPATSRTEQGPQRGMKSSSRREGRGVCYESDSSFSRRVPSVMCGRPRRSKGDLVCCAAVGCGHVSGLRCAVLGPLALMQSAAWLPNRFTRWNGA